MEYVNIERTNATKVSRIAHCQEAMLRTKARARSQRKPNPELKKKMARKQPKTQKQMELKKISLTRESPDGTPHS